MNFINLDEYESAMSTFVAQIAMDDPKLAEWATRLAGRTLTKHYAEELSKNNDPALAFRQTRELATQMGLQLSLVVTEQLYVALEVGLGSSIELTTLRKASKDTVEWARRAVTEGRLVYYIQIRTPGVIVHLAEAVANEFGGRKRDVYSVTYETASKWAREWQEREERKAKERRADRTGLHQRRFVYLGVAGQAVTRTRRLADAPLCRLQPDV